MKKSIYYNGTIITMEKEIYAEAVLVNGGIIEKVGKYLDILQFKDRDTEMIDLDGNTMMPSFIDSHSHITSLANSLRYVSLSDANSFDDIVSKLKEFKIKKNLKSGQWIVGFGYDNNFLKEKCHPTKDVLDKVSKENPILISHISGHMGVMNSLALQQSNITENTTNPDGGIIGRIDGTDNPNGYLEEKAFMNSTQNIPQITDDEICSLMAQAQNIYLQNGITTVQDGLVRDTEFKMLKLASNRNLIETDIIGYVDLKDSADIAHKNIEYISNYINGFKIGGYKIFLDGSPQGKTAWMSEPYQNSENGYRGYPIYKTEQVVDFIQTALNENMQLLAHCNGDAAAEQFIVAYEIAIEKTKSLNSIRPVMIHAQFLRHNQLDRMKAINMIPSFFIAHTYYWGDTHLQNFGKERAFHISPAKEAIDKNIVYTFHQDTPVIMPNMLETIWCAVNRISKAEIVIGEDEKIGVLDALKAVTINAAYQYFEENKKGSIQKGKLANFVILDRNPLKVDYLEIKDINVLATIKENICLFKI